MSPGLWSILRTRGFIPGIQRVFAAAYDPRGNCGTDQKHTCDMALALHVVGLLNIQFAIKGSRVYILGSIRGLRARCLLSARQREFRWRRSRRKIMVGQKLNEFKLPSMEQLKHVSLRNRFCHFRVFPAWILFLDRK